MTCTNNGYNLLRWLNKKRREALRKMKLVIGMRDGHPKTVLPKKVERVLLVSTSHGIGDALYVMGLAKVLHDRGVRLEVAALSQHTPLYERSHLFDRVYTVGRDKHSGAEYSAIVDLEFVNINHWRERRDFLKDSKGCRITTAPLCRDLPFYDDYLDYSKAAHVSERMRFVANKLLHESKTERVLPYLVTDEVSEVEANRFLEGLGTEKPIVYFNTRAGDEDRWFNKVQTMALLERLTAGKNWKVVLLPPDDDPCYFTLPDVVRWGGIDFSGFCSFLRHCHFVVTPDTSVTHVAGAWDVPCFTVFPPNDRDFFKEYGAWESWGAFSTLSTTFHPDAPDFRIDRFGFSNHRTQDASTIPVSVLTDALDAFLGRIAADDERKKGRCS